jgi:hypothetical protein
MLSTRLNHSKEGRQMASKGFKVTDNQKHVAELLYTFGNLSEGHTGERVSPTRVTELIKKGIVEKTNGTSPINYWELRFTAEGQAWADVQFGSNEPDPAPDVTPASSTPEAVAGETVAPVASTPVCDVCHENKSTVRMCYYNSTPVMLACTDCILDTEYEAPVADSDIPFAQGMDDSDDTPFDDLIDAALSRGDYDAYDATVKAELIAEWAVRDSEPIADSPDATMPTEPPITAQIQAQEGMQVLSSVNAPKAAKTPVITKKQRRKERQAAIRQQYARSKRPVANVINIAEVLRSMGIGAAA